MKVFDIITLVRNKGVSLSIENHNISLKGDTQNLSKDILDLIKSNKQEIIDFFDETSFSFENEITKTDKKEYYPLSNAQKRIWVLSQLEGGNKAYNIATSFYLKGKIERENLEKAFQLSIRKHEILRSVFRVHGNEPVVFILDDLDFSIQYLKLDNPENSKQILKSKQEIALNFEFDLEKGPLFFVHLFQFSENEFGLFFTMHHIISDGWSMGVFVQEVMANYKRICLNEEIRNDKQDIQYSDYVNWLEGKLKSEKGKKTAAFWKNKSLGEVEPIELPTDFKRPEVTSFDGALYKTYFSKDFHQSLLEFSKLNNTTLFNVLRAALSIVLHKYSDQETILIGSPVAGRTHQKLYNQIGLYINTLPLRSDYSKTVTFKEYLKSITEDSINCFAAQDFPLDQIIELSNTKRSLNRNVLFDVLLVVQNNAISDGSMDIYNQYGFTLQELDKYLFNGHQNEKTDVPSKFDISFNFSTELSGEYLYEIEYKTTLFKKLTIDKLSKSFEYVLRQVIENNQIQLKNIELTSSVQKDIILHSFNRPIETTSELSLNELLDASFVAFSGEIAVKFNDKEFTYSELNKKVNSIASVIRKKCASTPAKVAMLMGRSEQVLFSVLGIVRANCTYVPVDITYPQNRIDYILGDAQPELLIVDDLGIHLIPSDFKGEIIHMDELHGDENFQSTRVNQREDAAYVLYTSGSTGAPKGVEVTHRNVIAFLKWCLSEYAHTPYQTMLATTSYCFDLSVFEMFFPLLQGKSIRVLSSANEIEAISKTERTIFINTVPSVVRQLIDQDIDWSAVTALNMCGEPAPRIFKKQLDYTRMEVRNLYGPTEDTVFSTVYRFKEDQPDFLPIGVPISHSQLYIMDEDLNLLPEGVEGEICLTGESIAKGYLNKESLTQQSFLNNPFYPEYRLYKTGDIGKWLPDGQIEFIGRKDDQVKVRGHRIELGEIQFHIENIKEIQQACVVVREINAEPSLVAYYKIKSAVSKQEIEAILKEKLPAYILPSFLVEMDFIPMTSNGKVDKKQLPAPDPQRTSENIVLPVTPTEIALASIWKEVLGINTLGINDNFFELGGHSLNATRLRALIQNKLKKTVSLNELFQYSSIQTQAKLIDSKGISTDAKIEKAPVSFSYPLSKSQERLWVLTQFEEASKAYNMPAAFHIKGHFDLAVFESALNMVVEKHESLRTVFKEIDGEPRQLILDAKENLISVKRHELTQTDKDIQALINALWSESFDLENGPLLKCDYIQLHKEERYISFNMHHIISDGWSLGILYNDVVKAYNFVKNDERIQLNPLGIQYKDFSTWQKNKMTPGEIQHQLGFWREEVFGNGIPVLELPYDHHRPGIKTYNGHSYRSKVKAATLSSLKEISVQQGASLFMTLFTSVSILLKKLANQDQVVIGTPVSGRDNAQLHDQIGFYVNTLPVLSSLSGDDSFVNLLNRTKKNVLKSFDYQYFPFELLVEELQVKRDLSRSPLFDVLLLLQNDDRQIEKSGPDSQISLEHLAISNQHTKYDLTFSFAEVDNELFVELEYNTDLFREETIAGFTDKLHMIFDSVTADKDVLIKNIELITEEEKELVLHSFNQPIEETKELSINELLRISFKVNLNNPAVKIENKEFTYEELDRRVNNFAAHISEKCNYTPTNVALLLSRTENILFSILGIWRANCTYVPVDITYPENRIEYIITDSNPAIIIVDEAGLKKIPGNFKGKIIHVEEIQDNPGFEAKYIDQREDNAYFIYTSGSTGEPKGVEITHRNVIAFLKWCLEEFSETPYQTMLAITSYCFDLSVFELIFPLLQGKSVRILDSGIEVSKIIDFEEKLFINTVPSIVRLLIDEKINWSNVAALNMAGEPAPRIFKEQLDYRTIEIRNLYGPSEDTTYSTFYRFKDDNLESIPIGKPVGYTHLYIMDKDLNLLPIGVEGEICLSGESLAKGYLNKDELTKGKFIVHPFEKNKRLYRTGDIGKWLPDGQVEFIGRMDDQVKVRGYRIELGEIQFHLEKMDEIDTAFVFVNEVNKEQTIVAYYKVKSAISKGQIEAALKEKLPHYMLPSFLIEMQAFPLTPNGKLDKKELLKATEISSLNTEYVEPRNELDKKVIEIWKSILGVEKIGIKDSFFDLGGHSLKATKVITLIQEKYGIRIDLKALFEDPTVKKMSDTLDTLLWMNAQNSEMVSEDEMIL